MRFGFCLLCRLCLFIHVVVRNEIGQKDAKPQASSSIFLIKNTSIRIPTHLPTLLELVALENVGFIENKRNQVHLGAPSATCGRIVSPFSAVLFTAFRLPSQQTYGSLKLLCVCATRNGSSDCHRWLLRGNGRSVIFAIFLAKTNCAWEQLIKFIHSIF